MVERGYEFEGRESIKSILARMGFSEYSVDRVYLEVKNELSREKFEETRVPDRVLLLPHCMMDADGCEARCVEVGYECGNCGRCDLDEVTGIAEGLGYDHFIVPGGSMVRKIVDEMDYSVAVGVACFPELIDANRYLERNGMRLLMVELDEDGCFMTGVRVSEVERILRMGIDDGNGTPGRYEAPPEADLLLVGEEEVSGP
ncbi:MAG: hypothetical protein MAG715_00708 [Methanonatronarchaeales archaeon]|nr:hypothetical protein [Methanonatronarchaeales archaeon]